MAVTPQGRPFTTDEMLAVHQHAPGMGFTPVPNSIPVEWVLASPLTAGQLALIHRVPSLAGWGVVHVAGPGKGKL